MKVISFILAMCFSLNVLATSGTVQALERAIDEYQYSISTEWDQKDQSFLDQKTKEFMAKLRASKEAGLSQQEILNLVAAKTHNKEALEALKLKVSLLPKNLSEEELFAEIKIISKDVYARGSSWNGEAVVTYALAALVMGILVYSIHLTLTEECVRTEYQHYCSEFCFGSGDSRYCDRDCGYGDVCVEYAKKK